MEATELVIQAGEDAFDPGDKNSFFNMLPEHSKVLTKITELKSEIARGYSDQEFKEQFGYDKNYRMMRRIRINFWNLFNEQVGSPNPKIQHQRIWAGITSKATFLRLMNEDLYATFMLTQPQDVTLIQEDLLYEGYKYLEEILELDLHDQKGNLQNSLIGHKIKIIEMMENRLRGSVVQRAQIHTTENQSNSAPDDKAEALKIEIAKLRQEMGVPDIEVVSEQ